jgi:tRNA G18 (ribose-2'-O)-methylase SpoU
MVRLNANIREIRAQEIPHMYSDRNVHDHLRNHTVDELKAITAAHTQPFRVMLLNVLGDLNQATVIRSAHLMGAEECVVFGRRRIDNRGLVGAANYTPVTKIWAVDENLELQTQEFESYCVTNNVVPVFVEQGGSNVFEFDWKGVQHQAVSSGQKIMLVLGTERDGIPASMIQAGLDLGGHVVSIPQTGVIRSHNLSMAFAIVGGIMVDRLGWY